MTDESGFRVTPRLVLGLIVLGLGVLFLLDNLHILEAEQLLRYWPAILIAIGLVKIFQRGAAPTRATGIFWVLGGGVLLLINTDLVQVSFSEMVPFLLLIGGAFIVWQAIMGRRQWAGVTDAGATLSAIALMSGVERRVLSQEFRGGEATAIMGGCEIDLRGASIAQSPAVIDTFAWWGGVELIVPEDWVVVGKVVPLMGGFEDKTTAAAPGSVVGPRKELIVKGFAIMGGVEVRNKP